MSVHNHNQQVMTNFFEQYFGQFPDRTGNLKESTSIFSNLKESTSIFSRTLGLQNPHEANVQNPIPPDGAPQARPGVVHVHHHHRESTFNNPYFWLWITHRHQPQVYNRYTYFPVRDSMGRLTGRVMQVAGNAVGRPDRNQQEKENRAKVAVALLAITVLLADVAAAVTAVFVTKDAFEEAAAARGQELNFNRIAKNLTDLSNASVSINDRRPYFSPAIQENLRQIGSNLKEIGHRAAVCSRVRAIGVGFLAAASVGGVHLLVSAIACAIISGSELAATATGISALAMFSSSFSPPCLIALATIAAIGGLLHFALQRYNKDAKDRVNAQQGLENVELLMSHVLADAAPSAPLLPQWVPSGPPPAYPS